MIFHMQNMPSKYLERNLRAKNGLSSKFEKSIFSTIYTEFWLFGIIRSMIFLKLTKSAPSYSKMTCRPRMMLQIISIDSLGLKKHFLYA